MDSWKRLEFSAEENEVLDLGSETETNDPLQNTVVGKMWTTESYNVKAFKATMLNIWKTRGAVEIVDLEKNLFSFKFETQRDRDLILKGQPWTFDGHVLALQQISGGEQPSEICPHSCPIWVRIYDLPLNLRNEPSIRKIGGSLGEVLEYDKSEECLRGKYARVRVKVDLLKPLKRGSPIQIATNKKGRIFFKYERLPDFCFMCGVLGYTLRSCPEKEEDIEGEELKDLPYGAWMRASPKKVTLMRKDGYAERNKTIKKSLFGQEQNIVDEHSEGSPQPKENSPNKETTQGDDSQTTKVNPHTVTQSLDKVAEVFQLFNITQESTETEQEVNNEDPKEKEPEPTPSDPVSNETSTGKGLKSWKRAARTPREEPSNQHENITGGKRTEMEIDGEEGNQQGTEKRNKSDMIIDEISAVLEDQHGREP
ncbi:uncharacterized protein LOC130719778 [Lotus japonicus]|uniref:uncharacterized protein LOC130719778 n=1 Tax=Lotus japonicus TaxID=34305 RepID=UPI002584642F|nr:uncharacterized protein LOC130719778 [Lotus japonicus]